MRHRNASSVFSGPRQAAVVFVFFVGVVVVCSAILINPYIGALTKGDRIVDFSDALHSYFAFSFSLGITFVLLAARMNYGPSWADNLVLLGFVLGGILLADRFILTRVGLPLWIHDAELHYKHRPGAVRTLSQYGRPKDLIKINQWGFHDGPIELAKPPNEYRVLVLGDSLTMAYGLTQSESFSSVVEEMWKSSGVSDYRLEMINTAVHGYSTGQQRLTLERAMAFEPDLILLSFCMNDVTEPFLIDTSLGGTGLDYHGIRQANSRVAGWIANETGFGRLSQVLAERETTLAVEKLREVHNVRSLAQSTRNGVEHRTGWDLVLNQLNLTVSLAKGNDVPFLLVVFPYDFQLIDEGMQFPQAILADFAMEVGVPIIDLTQPLAEEIFNSIEVVEFLRSKGYGPREILDWHRSRIEEFYFDDNHFTRAGHKFIANQLLPTIQGMILSSSAKIDDTTTVATPKSADGS